MDQWIEQAKNQIIEKMRRNVGEIGADFPNVCREDRYGVGQDTWWTNGFWPGMLWLAYRETDEEVFAKTANQIEEMLDTPLHDYLGLHHDVGFMWLLSSVAQYKLNGNEASRRRALIAASFLASRYNIKGKFIRAWNVGSQDEPPVAGWAIIDCMMNIPILFWASEQLNDPRYRHIACAHADTVMKEFIQEDGSSHHIVCFDPESGKRICSLGGQGYSPTSAWSRGAGWAIYGMAMAYSYTGKERYLKTAKRVAKFFINSLPEDKVPYWDFRAPIHSKTPRDTSAAAIAACGMLEMSKYTKTKVYQKAAEDILKSLYNNYSNWDTGYQGMLTHATGDNAKKIDVEVSLIYGDYYFMEGILRLLGKDRLF